jgi:2-iminobutanoate/2-iminopropanoate deaminase
MPSHRQKLLVIVALTVSLFTIAACGGAASNTPEPSAKVRQLIHPHPDMGYSDASRYGDLVWTAGHLPFQANSTDPFATQVEAVLDNLEATLEEAGAGFDTVLKTNVYLMSFDDWPVFNEVYVNRLGQYGLPPRSTIQVAGLGLGRIEIEMVAYVRAPVV